MATQPLPVRPIDLQELNEQELNEQELNEAEMEVNSIRRAGENARRTSGQSNLK